MEDDVQATIPRNFDFLIKTLVERRIIESEEVPRLQRVAANTLECTVIDLLIQQNRISSDEVARLVAAHFGFEFVEISRLIITEKELLMVPAVVVHRYRIIPLLKMGTDAHPVLSVALSNPADLDMIGNLGHFIKADLCFKVAAPEDIDRAIKQYYPGGPPVE